MKTAIKFGLQFGDFKMESVQERLGYFRACFFFGFRHCSFESYPLLLLYAPLCFVDSLLYTRLKIGLSVFHFFLESLNDRQNPIHTFAVVNDLSNSGSCCISRLHALCLPLGNIILTKPQTLTMTSILQKGRQISKALERGSLRYPNNELSTWSLEMSWRPCL